MGKGMLSIGVVSLGLGCGPGVSGRSPGDETGTGSGIDSLGGTASADGTRGATTAADTSASTSASASGSAADGTSDGDSSGPPSDPLRFDVGLGEPPCVNLECQQMDCGPGVSTTVSGTVYDPSGTLPLYNVQVYIPNAPVAPIVDELICDQCGTQLSGDPLVSAVTDTEGRFVLEHVPVGQDIPLVMQVGKWRRQVTLPAVEACQSNELADPQLTRLPRSTAEGDLPRIALSTGGADPLFCLLRRLGIADEEFGISGSDARIHFFHGSSGSGRFDNGFGASPGATLPEATDTLWQAGWQDYDIVLLSCEGATYAADKTDHRVKLRDYLDIGGRAFATHYHYTWMQEDAPDDLASVATFRPNVTSVDGIVDIDTSFPKGNALADWLHFVDGASPWSQFVVSQGRDHTIGISDWPQRWVTYGDDEQIMYFSFNSPIGAEPEAQCGRMVYSDIHVSISGGDPNGAFPGACNDSPLSEQEKVLLFMLFDLSGCIAPDVPPP